MSDDRAKIAQQFDRIGAPPPRQQLVPPQMLRRAPGQVQQPTPLLSGMDPALMRASQEEARQARLRYEARSDINRAQTQYGALLAPLGPTVAGMGSWLGARVAGPMDQLPDLADEAARDLQRFGGDAKAFAAHVAQRLPLMVQQKAGPSRSGFGPLLDPRAQTQMLAAAQRQIEVAAASAPATAASMAQGAPQAMQDVSGALLDGFGRSMSGELIDGAAMRAQMAANEGDYDAALGGRMSALGETAMAGANVGLAATGVGGGARLLTGLRLPTAALDKIGMGATVGGAAMLAPEATAQAQGLRVSQAESGPQYTEDEGAWRARTADSTFPLASENPLAGKLRETIAAAVTQEFGGLVTPEQRTQMTPQQLEMMDAGDYFRARLNQGDLTYAEIAQIATAVGRGDLAEQAQQFEAGRPQRDQQVDETVGGTLGAAGGVIAGALLPSINRTALGRVLSPAIGGALGGAAGAAGANALSGVVSPDDLSDIGAWASIGAGAGAGLGTLRVGGEAALDGMSYANQLTKQRRNLVLREEFGGGGASLIEDRTAAQEAAKRVADRYRGQGVDPKTYKTGLLADRDRALMADGRPPEVFSAAQLEALDAAPTAQDRNDLLAKMVGQVDVDPPLLRLPGWMGGKNDIPRELRDVADFDVKSRVAKQSSALEQMGLGDSPLARDPLGRPEYVAPEELSDTIKRIAQNRADREAAAVRAMQEARAAGRAPPPAPQAPEVRNPGKPFLDTPRMKYEARKTPASTPLGNTKNATNEQAVALAQLVGVEVPMQGGKVNRTDLGRKLAEALRDPAKLALARQAGFAVIGGALFGLSAPSAEASEGEEFGEGSPVMDAILPASLLLGAGAGAALGARRLPQYGRQPIGPLLGGLRKNATSTGKQLVATPLLNPGESDLARIATRNFTRQPGSTHGMTLGLLGGVGAGTFAAAPVVDQALQERAYRSYHSMGPIEDAWLAAEEERLNELYRQLYRDR
jgi:hypothetical protein